MADDRLIKTARGEIPADLILSNARVVNVFNGEVEQADVAVCGDRIAGVGEYREGAEVIDLAGRYLVPGLINGHTHLESSMLDVGQYARAVVPGGTLAIVTDLHEIANVAGIEGVRYILDGARRLPLELFLMAPSCVPATPLETAGAELGPEDVRRMMRWRGVIGLGEMMNYPGVLFADGGVLSKIGMAGDRPVDGHAPGLAGKDLNAYIAAGIRSDHESVAYEEGREKLRRGMYLMIREGSSEKNLAELLPLVTDNTYKRCLFVVDDRSCVDLLNDGDIAAVVRRAIALGLEPVRAVQLATINPAEYFRLSGLGGIAPGYTANLVAVKDLADFRADMVFHHGRLVARAGEALFAVNASGGRRLRDTVNLKGFDISALEYVPAAAEEPAIEVVPGQIITRQRMVEVGGGVFRPDTGRDILKLVVVERHRATGNIGVGLVTGFGLKEGALASSVAHDSHNIVAVGVSDEDIYLAVRELERMGGGLVAVAGGKVLARLPLPVAGLLSDRPLDEVVAQLDTLEKTAARLGTPLVSPFSTLSFMALPVIPELRLTDKGLVDVNKFEIIKPGKHAG